jgi:hypothetical protein
MNTNQFELFVAQITPAISLRWIMTGDGLRMQWAPETAQPEGNILRFAPSTATYSQPAAA